MDSEAQHERPAKDEAGSEVSEREIQAALDRHRVASDVVFALVRYGGRGAHPLQLQHSFTEVLLPDIR
jgi:hypothetical protein